MLFDSYSECFKVSSGVHNGRNVEFVLLHIWRFVRLGRISYMEQIKILFMVPMVMPYIKLFDFILRYRVLFYLCLLLFQLHHYCSCFLVFFPACFILYESTILFSFYFVHPNIWEEIQNLACPIGTDPNIDLSRNCSFSNCYSLAAFSYLSK